MKRWAVSALVFFLLAHCPVFAGEKGARGARQEKIKKEKKLEDVKKQIRVEKKGIKEIAKREKDILVELDEINKTLSSKGAEIKKVESSRAALDMEIASSGAGIGRLEAEKTKLKERLTRRLRAMYKMKRGEAVRALFSSSTPADLGRRHRYLTLIMDSDISLIARYEDNLKNLEAERGRMTKLTNELDSVRKDLIAKKGETETLRREKSALLKNTKYEKAYKVRLVGELEKAAVELSELLSKLRAQPSVEAAPDPSGGFASMKGRLPMPLSGKVASTYGRVKHPKFHTVTFNNGIIIEAPVGTPVMNIFEGRVAYAGWLRGYGQVMIIDHGAGFYTLLAHLSKMLKEKNAAVSAGVVVALAGDTGPTALAGLYFEIRQKGVPRDPLAWFVEGG
ncbi:MAG: peptidoglycan DD-metalloendopeptidase family protein [Deltaproteobacteria bacterium]|nr:peptidoglycan DD-metalloendopeptidase family protein [Deltaproteobacteria bacterium]